MPGGRAIVGGLLVAAAAVIVFAATLAGSRVHGLPYVVAARALPAGSVISPGDVTTETMNLAPSAQATAFGQDAAVIGRTVEVPIPAGELVESSMLAGSGSGSPLRPVSVAVDTGSLAGLRPGMSIDVLAASSSPSDGSSGASSKPATVTVVLRGVSLLSLGTSGSGLQGTTTVVTIGVPSLGEAESLVQAAASGTVVLIQAEPSDGSGAGPPGSGTTPS